MAHKGEYAMLCYIVGSRGSDPIKSRVPSIIMICMKKLRFSSRARAKVRHQRPLGSARAQP